MIINNREYDNYKIRDIMEFIIDSQNNLVDDILQKTFAKEKIDKSFYDSKKIEILDKIWEMLIKLEKKDIYKENEEEIDLSLDDNEDSNDELFDIEEGSR